MADTDSYEHLYDLPETTSAIGTDVIPIEQSDGTKKIGVSNLLKDVTSYADVYSKSETYEKSEIDAAIADKALKHQSITIPIASVTATPDDDEFKTETDAWNAHPYCYNYPITGLTADYECHINMSSNLSIADGTWQTMAGVLRIYLRSMPTTDITVQCTLQKAVA